ncbi:hypothetical protein NQ314_006599 [Rhamnusium bicolor]|uniref:Uncharacterized protein n=1 Tax=Rhamnusium bicolor TaxID=1586634 RepID=A0AAV8YYN3_9CUCU|nr:hypothetical protein NQ314_006599 [Rhamnusium bicolor]
MDSGPASDPHGQNLPVNQGDHHFHPRLRNELRTITLSSMKTPRHLLAYTMNFFGNFKGFSISPAKKVDPEPIRVAPPPPVIPPSAPPVRSTPSFNKAAPNMTVATVKASNVNRSNTLAAKTNFFNKPIQKHNSFKGNTLSNGISTAHGTSVAPALPPPNPGSNARPIISSPVLENSTCTAKELISPLRNAPKIPFRAAPEAPNIIINNENKRPLSTPEVSNTIFNIKVNEEIKKLPKEKESVGASALNRITSFLKTADKKPVVQSNSLPKTNQVKANKVLDKDTLRSMEISNPIPQTKIDIAITAVPVNTEASKAVVMRAQSMRVAKDTPRPNITHIWLNAPPPPRPPAENVKVKTKTTSVKALGKADQNQYDDCLNEAAPLPRISEATSPTSGDNIYAVIEESPISPVCSLSPEKVTSNSGSSDSMGLLGEIVSEIQNRNFDSIYSTSTLARKKKEAEEKLKREKSLTSPDSSETYVNTASLFYPDSEYSNMSGHLKSSASSTSSGYIHPSAVNVPVKSLGDKKAVTKTDEISAEKPGLSTFKSESTKPFSSTFNRSQGPVASSFKSNASGIKKQNSPSPTSKTPPSPTTKTVPKATVNRQITPPNLRTRKPSPTRAAPQGPKSNRSITNSPDLVTSCNANAAAKPPDVLNGGTTPKKPSISNAKPTINNLPKAQTKK